MREQNVETGMSQDHFPPKMKKKNYFPSLMTAGSLIMPGKSQDFEQS